jgi:thioredoxin-dependent peroxiredoxin
MILKEGKKAPDFQLQTQDDSTVSLESFKGQLILLYFYPRDDTPGCTKESCGLRDIWKELKKLGVVVLGASPDSVKSHKKFAAKYKLPFLLLADPDKELVQKYGVWGEKKFMGMKFQGVHRTTFLIEKDGKILKIWEKVKPADHPGEIIEFVKNLP